MFCRLSPHIPLSSRTVESWTSEPVMYVRSFNGNRCGFTTIGIEAERGLGRSQMMLSERRKRRVLSAGSSAPTSSSSHVLGTNNNEPESFFTLLERSL